jgi:acetylornithine deacetylase/succinyl-diaminopimelate desuccinylase-like protein
MKSPIENYLKDNANEFEKTLCDWLSIPSISADPKYAKDVVRAADWLVDRFKKIGLTSRRVETAGHPLVTAEWLGAGPGAPTALVYGHYDVQPVDPLDQWKTGPFEPTKRDGNLYARGATDDKGQLLTHIVGAEAWLKTEGRLPVNLKFLIEGEEESEGTAIDEYLAAHTEELSCDCLVVSDSGQFGPNQPAITCGLRGIVYAELVIEGPNRDLHSGSFGGTLTNPAIALAKMLSTLTDSDNRITVPGFYDEVVELSEEEKSRMAELPFDERLYKDELGVAELDGERGYTTLQRRWIRPTFDICGLTSGYQGEGGKTIIPAYASAKLSFRLVPNQDPQKILAALKKQFEAVCPAGVRMKFIPMVGSPGMLVGEKSPYRSAAARAIERAFGVEPVSIREGGSIPIVADLANTLGVDALLLGWGQDDDNTHSPNEKFSLADFHRGAMASAILWEEMAKLSSSEEVGGDV